MVGRSVLRAADPGGRARPSTRQMRMSSRSSAGTIGNVETVILWRPTGPEELAPVEASGWREWPPRLPDQPIFYPC